VTSVNGADVKGRLTLGLVLLAIGLVLILAQAGVLHIDGLGRWWPLFVIGIGVVKYQQPREAGQRAIGVALLFVGGMFQLMSVLSLAKGLPLVLMGVGALLLWQGIERPPGARPVPAQSPYLSEMALIGYLKRGVSASPFRGGYVTAVMGGVELDLRTATIGTEPAVLDLVAFWGGIDLKVPAAWTVEAEVLPFLGAFENKTQPPADAGVAPRLVVRGYAVMGGVVIGH
jgi:Domain of unknown function (DUF5668)